MEIEKLLNSHYYNEENISNAFYELCSQDLQSITIKKLFLKLDYREKLTSQVLSYGIIGALENNQEKYVPLIIGHMDKNKIKADAYSLTKALMVAIEKNKYKSVDNIALDWQNAGFFVEKEPELLEMLMSAKDSIEGNKDKGINTILDYLEKSDFNPEKNFKYLELMFNCSTKANNFALAKKLDNKYSILEKSIITDIGEDYIDLLRGSHSAFASLNSDGSLFIGGSMGGEQSALESKLGHYSFNPILFNLNNFNAELLDTFFKNDYEVHPSVVTQALVSSVYLNNSEAVLYLFSNEKCAKIIKNSPQLRAFINSDTDFADRKKEARIALSMIELNEELGDNNNSKNKMKI